VEEESDVQLNPSEMQDAVRDAVRDAVKKAVQEVVTEVADVKESDEQ
jgi:hypothetical protein